MERGNLPRGELSMEKSMKTLEEVIANAKELLFRRCLGAER
jgi:hypothetical protein